MSSYLLWQGWEADQEDNCVNDVQDVDIYLSTARLVQEGRKMKEEEIRMVEI